MCWSGSSTRCEGEVGAKETPIGYVPEIDDLDMEGLDISKETLADLLNVDKDIWKDEAAGIEEFYKKFGDRLPAELKKQLDELKARLA